MLTLQERFWVKVAKTETCWVWTASTNGNGYGNFAINRKPAYVHRLSYEWHRGPIPVGMFVDHMCHNKLCVNPGHLRLASNKQNSENRKGAQSNSKSGVRGVSWCNKKERWRATVGDAGKFHHCGYFPTIAEAERAVIAARNRLFTHNLLDANT